MSDHAYAQVYSLIKMQQAEGLEMDKNILDIRDVQLQVGSEAMLLGVECPYYWETESRFPVFGHRADGELHSRSRG